MFLLKIKQEYFICDNLFQYLKSSVKTVASSLLQSFDNLIFQSIFAGDLRIVLNGERMYVSRNT